MQVGYTLGSISCEIRASSWFRDKTACAHCVLVVIFPVPQNLMSFSQETVVWSYSFLILTSLLTSSGWLGNSRRPRQSSGCALGASLILLSMESLSQPVTEAGGHKPPLLPFISGCSQQSKPNLWLGDILKTTAGHQGAAAKTWSSSLQK